MAETDPDGLLAIGGDLEPIRLINAYSSGIFPWYSNDQPILWWSPNPRTLLFPDKLHLSKSLAKKLRQGRFHVSCDLAFNRVVTGCASVTRKAQDGTWIIAKMQTAYKRLHVLGYAHSVEVWQDQRLVGGLYGIAIGKAFYGESMFSLVADASKIALAVLTQRLHRWGFHFVDCQIVSSHLQSLGADTITRKDFLKRNQIAIASDHSDTWRQEAIATNAK